VIERVAHVTIGTTVGDDLDTIVLNDRVAIQLLTKQTTKACLKGWIYGVRQ
jgi:hypothetical protein